jgi:hypothetical protein
MRCWSGLIVGSGGELGCDNDPQAVQSKPISKARKRCFFMFLFQVQVASLYDSTPFALTDGYVLLGGIQSQQLGSSKTE